MIAKAFCIACLVAFATAATEPEGSDVLDNLLEGDAVTEIDGPEKLANTVQMEAEKELGDIEKYVSGIDEDLLPEVNEAAKTFEGRIRLLIGEEKTEDELHSSEGIEKVMVELAAMPACIDEFSACVKDENFVPACLNKFLKCDDPQDSKKLLPDGLKAALDAKVAKHYAAPAPDQKAATVAEDVAAGIAEGHKEAAPEAAPAGDDSDDQGSGESAALAAWLQTQNATEISERSLERARKANAPKTLAEHEFEHCQGIFDSMTTSLASESSVQRLLAELRGACESESEHGCHDKAMGEVQRFKNMTLEYKMDAKRFCRKFMDPHGTHDPETHRDLTLLEDEDEQRARLHGYKHSHLLLQDLPMIMSHDAGTGYGMEVGVTSPFSQCQAGNFAQQLNCGVRAFDLRPFMKTKMSAGKSLPCWAARGDCPIMKMHHGGFVTKGTLEDALRDVTSWTKQHPNELVLLLMKNTGTDDETQWGWSKRYPKILEIVKSFDIHYVHESAMNGMTVAKAYKDSYRAKHGRVLAMFNGVQGNYDASVKCYGNPFKKCYTDHMNWWSDSEYDRHYDNYMKKYCKKSAYPSRGKLMQQQAHWQQDGGTLVSIGAAFSSIMADTRKSNINTITAQRIDSGHYGTVSMVELDDVCHNNGAPMYDAIRRRQIKVMGSMANGQTSLHRHSPHRHNPSRRRRWWRL